MDEIVVGAKPIWFVGGELKTYTQLMEHGFHEAMRRMEKSAIELGADGIYGVSMATPQVTAGAAEIIMFGTAYSIETEQ